MLKKTPVFSLSQPMLSLTLYAPIFTVTHKKSYYQLLKVSKTAKPKQIRSQFLKLARQLHPDHNSSPQAQQQFKKLKQAYQTLKDPYKRYIYDTGISTENNPDFQGTNPSPNPNANIYEQGSKNWRNNTYYNNKWYEYKKHNYDNQRDEYYQSKFQQDQFAYRIKWWYRLLGVCVFAGIGWAYWYLMVRKGSEDYEREHVRIMIGGMGNADENRDREREREEKKIRKMARYIEERARQNKVQ